MNKIYFIPFLFFIIIGCGSSEKNKYFEEVMQIHDEVMPKTSDIAKLSRYFEKLIENKEIDSTQIIESNRMIEQLDRAHESMMSWMNDFDVPEENSEAINYLKDQETKITSVKTEMLQAISDAEILKNKFDEN